MNDIAEALFTRINNQIQVNNSDVRLYHGVAPRSTQYPYITYLSADEYPILFHNSEGDNPPISEMYWDFTIYSNDAMDIGSIYEGLLDIFNSHDIDNIIGIVRSTGMPMIIDDNQPDNLVYSRTVECKIFVRD